MSKSGLQLLNGDTTDRVPTSGHLQCLARIWDKEGLPTQCTNQAICPQHGKGSRMTVCRDHKHHNLYERGVILLDHYLSYVRDNISVRERVPWWHAPDLYEEVASVVKYKKPATCGIYTGPQTRMCKLKGCGHEVCAKCLCGWIRSTQEMCHTCPYCRHSMKPAWAPWEIIIYVNAG